MRRHVPALDGLRAIAIAVVMALHAGVPHATGGYLGVDIFFVLSGYLITSILLREQATTGRIDLRRFYAKRALRLFPALVAVVFVGFLFVGDLGVTRGGYAKTAAASLLYVQNLFTLVTGQAHALGHSWSLAQEEQFYLIWPVALLLVIRRWGRRGAVVAAGSAALASLACYPLLLHPMIVDQPAAYYNPLTRCGGMFLGCLLALLMERRKLPHSQATAATVVGVAGLGVAVLLMPHFLRGAVGTAVAIPLADFATVALLAGLVSSEMSLVSRALAWRPFVGLGRISYGLYLIHLPAFLIVRQHVQGGLALVIAVETTAALALAVLSYQLVEVRFLRLKDRIGSRTEHRVVADNKAVVNVSG